MSEILDCCMAILHYKQVLEKGRRKSGIPLPHLLEYIQNPRNKNSIK